ncbi:MULTISPECIES: DUF1413 domain-containing protein [Staphylococcus]|mgnify:FL=1|jgi:hypothetical protein|uniref:DUF1413 domain-containing protein n=1 Tax=Staphylococcus nepalensis TaxID=214473 RepID=A0A291JI97_9STAP|nr:MULTISPECIES: DUF1413 domain-containing protein [Staphylococcus]VDG66200.1 Domain of uncharacterised function (DUF1413) [Lacrimispora indolis]ATH59280.1 hypothetical protein BJD96_02465 [Staphylococcus nepalensis]ATH64373.1 hypothetical protein BJG89_02810 [Staphylococcus nepalensis]AWI43733.1 hypothetical protein BJG88_02535 [Staphylococcus nepalensis]MBO1205587.1 DUF1413 domain-containing protein [Staphylococcus nepalensis]
MDFEDSITQLRQSIDRTSFSFRFEQLFVKEDWLKLSLTKRQQLEREFRKFVNESDKLRIPYASEDHIRMRMYNAVYDYNEIKHNFKAYV